jgi:hypothetical protein
MSPSAAGLGGLNDVRIEESAEAVTLYATTDLPLEPDRDACSDGLRVTLEAPLADRQLIDGESGQQVEVRDQ